MCAVGGIDVGVQQLRNGEVLFKLGPRNNLLVGGDTSFQLLVDVAVTGRLGH